MKDLNVLKTLDFKRGKSWKSTRATLTNHYVSYHYQKDHYYISEKSGGHILVQGTEKQVSDFILESYPEFLL